MKRRCRGLNGETEWISIRGDIRYVWDFKGLIEKIREFGEWYKERSKYMASKLLRLLKYEEKMKNVYERYGIVVIGFNDWLYDTSIIWILRNDRKVDIRWYNYNCKQYFVGNNVVVEECSALSPLDSPGVRARREVLFYISRSDEIIPD